MRKSQHIFTTLQSNFDKKTIHCIEDDQGHELTDGRQIRQQITNFYEKLYTSTVPSLSGQEWDDIYQTTLNGNLSDEERASLESDITEKECLTALKTMKPNKSPGCDGIGPEFYLKFWSVLEGKLIQTCKYSLSEGELSQYQRRAVISLLHKKGKDEKEIQNTRPISLLNYDYKILTKVFPKRIVPFLSKLIHEDQSGFVKGRFIGEHIRYLSDLIDYANEKQFSCILLSLDFFKAYDTVE